MSFSLTLANNADINAFLESRSYVIGFAPTQSDVALFKAIGSTPDAKAFPNVARFFAHIASFSEDARSRWPAGVSTSAGAAAGAGAGAGGPAKGKKKPVESDSDSDDMFADSDDEDPKAKAKAKAKAAAAKAKAAAAKKTKKPKAKKIEMTQCVYEVKPLEAGQDMKKLEESIRALTLDGLTWGEQFGVVDVAFGIQKMLIQCVIINEKVDTASIEELLESLEDQVQSVDLATMNRL
mmetsp:Transcript_41521/g.54660  ORF Transcript_41521/g.54660 Transcript_41521/m.54660 type:complete len:237 (+) Transcript_41521:48-758(+)